jgi:flavodoxin
MPGIKTVYVTRTGHARALAERIAALSGGTAAEIGDPSNRKGIFGFLKSGAQASKGSYSPYGPRLCARPSGAGSKPTRPSSRARR